ncbi:MAG: polysaccharide deacetylase family protein, partial [Alphaproteobacteria bacterium]
MLDPATWSLVDFPPEQPPLLAVVVDTEEDFDWGQPLARSNTGVSSTSAQTRAHRIFERFGLKPTYVVDYPVASRREGFGPLRELLESGACEIGSHLHPWVTPPHVEEVTPRNSFPGNLAPDLEREKLRTLTRTIEDNFGVTPVVYKAGRYGVGPATPAILHELGYRIDTSVVPFHDIAPEEGGPDFRHCPAKPYWFGPSRTLLEVPLTAGFAGTCASLGSALFPVLASKLGLALHLPGVAARLRLLDRIRLTPEGVTPGEHRALTRALLETGHRVFVFSYHSPSLAPGNTPYVRSDAELAAFLDRFERYFDFFMGEIGGQAATLTGVEALV